MSKPEYIEQVIIAALKESQVVAAICSGRVYPVRIPQGVKMPVVAIQRTYSGPDMTLSGYSSESVMVMVNCFALTWEQAKNLALAVRESMAARPVNAILRDEFDLFENTHGVFCVNAEYICQQSGGFGYGD